MLSCPVLKNSTARSVCEQVLTSYTHSMVRSHTLHTHTHTQTYTAVVALAWTETPTFPLNKITTVTKWADIPSATQRGSVLT